MYGISNSQQQGGGGGSAASYKAIKSTLTPSDWQEVAGAMPYFVGDDATTWATDSDTQQPTKTSNSNLGIITGQQYTITITANGVTYSSTATAESVNSGMLMLTFTFSETANAMFMLYDHIDWATKTVGDGSVIMVSPGQNTSLVITNFSGDGFGTTIQATIADSAIKVNSAVTIYTNTSEKIAVGEKTSGSVTLTADSIPTTSIPYSLEIVGTDTEGLFELINGYVPAAGITDYDGLQNVPIVNQDLSESGFTPVKDTYYRHTGTTNSDYTNGVIYKCVDIGSTSRPLRLYEVASMHDVYTAIDEGVTSLLPTEKDITEASTNVSITGSASPYLFTVTDSDIGSYDFIRLYPMDEDTETWLNEHTLSSIITEESGQFTFKVDTNTLPTAYSMKYVIERFM